MKLFTKDIDKKLFAQFPKGGELANQKVIAKIFNPYGRGIWYIINSDPNDPDYLWAIVNLFEVEVGSVSRKELESLRIKPFMLPLERDLYFSERNALEVYEGALKGERFEYGGEMDDEEGVDLFEDYEDQPEEVSELLSTLEVEDYNYDSLNDLLSEMKKIGYTFEFGLDAEPYDLRKIGQKGKSEFYAKGGQTEKRQMTLLESKSLSTPRKRVLTSQDYEKMYIYDNGVLYDTDYMLNKTTSYRMSKIDLTILPLEYNKGKMAEGGKLDESTKMVLSQNKAIAHHTEELKNALKKDPNVEPWVIGKVGRAETDISDVTHYLDGRSEYADGGRLSDANYLVGMAEEYAEVEYEKPVKKGQGTAKATKNGDILEYTEVTVFFKDGTTHLFTKKDFSKFFNMYGEGGKIGETYSHKYIPTMTLEVTDYTSNGVKGIQKDSKSLSKIEKTKGKIVTYSKSELKELWDKQFAKGGFTPNIVSKNNRKFGTSMYYERFEDAIGSFGWNHGTYNEGILYPLSDFDKKYYSHLKLKDGEVLLRYKTERMIPSSGKYLIKMNIDKGLVYFLNDSNDDDDKNPTFDSRGTKLEYLAINETYFDLEMFEKGGLTFDQKVKAVEKSLMSREVPKKYRNSYGKTYNKAEAHESAQKIIGAQVKKYNKK